MSPSIWQCRLRSRRRDILADNKTSFSGLDVETIAHLSVESPSEFVAQPVIHAAAAVAGKTSLATP